MPSPSSLPRMRRGTPGDGWASRLLDGPPLALPSGLDRAAEGWWRLPARLRTIGVVALTALVALGAAHRSSSTPWGESVEVVVAAGDVDAGQALDAQLATRPARLVPEDALTTVPDGIAVRDLEAGQVVTHATIGDDLHALLEHGEVALPLSQELPEMPAHAELVVLGLDFGGTGQALGRGRLLAHVGGWTWIAVDQADAPRIAAATHTGGVHLALAPR